MNPDNKKVALVTGASSGIGEAIVYRLLNEGWVVYGAARRIDRMQNIKKLGAHLLAIDVTDDKSMQEGINQLLSSTDHIDLLVNNAGYGSYGALEDVDIKEAKRQFEVNVFGLVRMYQLVMPTMRQKNSGLIINISSVAGRLGMPLGGWYHATKHSVEVLSDIMRMECKRFGINVSVIQPGPIRSEWPTIARETLAKASGNGVYSKEAKLVSDMLVNSYTPKLAPGPDCIANLVSKAVNKSKPKRRYAAPFSTRFMILLHKILPGAILDWIIMRAFKMNKI